VGKAATLGHAKLPRAKAAQSMLIALLAKPVLPELVKLMQEVVAQLLLIALLARHAIKGLARLNPILLAVSIPTVPLARPVMLEIVK
jgi:hypothetical protein